MGEPKRIQPRATTTSTTPSSLERDEVATDFSDHERDAVDQLVSIATTSLDTGNRRILARCPEEFAHIGHTLANVLDLDMPPTERLRELRELRGQLRRPMEQIALEDGGGALAQRLEDELVEKQVHLTRYEQRLRVNESGWIDGKVVDGADDADRDESIERMTQVYDGLRRLAAAVGVKSALDDAFNPKSKAEDIGMSKMGLAIDVLEFKTTALLDELIAQATRRGVSPEVLASLGKASDKLNGTIGGLAAAFGLAEGLIDVLSSESSTGAKIDGARAILTNGMQLVGAGAQLAGLAWGAALAGAGTWITIGYQYAKFVFATLWDTRMSLVRITLNNKLAQVEKHVASVHAVIDRMERAHALAADEVDPAKLHALAQYEQELAAEAGAAIDQFIGALEGPEGDHMRYEWSLDVPVMQRLFGPVMARRGLRGRDEVVQSMVMMFEGLAYAVTHGQQLGYEMTTGEVPK